MDGISEMLKGVLEGVILQVISRGETYGYAIMRDLNERGFSGVVEGSVYTVLLRIEKKGLVHIQKRASSLGPARKFYTLSERGQLELRQFWQRWDFLTGRLDELKKEDQHGT